MSSPYDARGGYGPADDHRQPGGQYPPQGRPPMPPPTPPPAPAGPGQSPEAWADGYGSAPFTPPRPPASTPAFVLFLRRDTPSLVAATVALFCGLVLLLTPRLAWVTTVLGSFSAGGGSSLSRLAGSVLDYSDYGDLLGEFTSIDRILREALDPLEGMLTLSALVTMIGALLMLSTSRRLGAAITLAGALGPITFLTILLGGFYSTRARVRDDYDVDAGWMYQFSWGKGLWLTLVFALIALGCAVVVFTRPADGPPPRNRPSAPSRPQAPSGPQPPAGPRPMPGPHGPTGPPGGGRPPRDPWNLGPATEHPGW